MNTISAVPLTTGSKAMVAVSVMISVINLVDYVFHGQEPRNIVAALGFALMGYGTYRNGLGNVRADGDRPVAADLRARYVTAVGVVLVTASFAMRYLM